MLRDNLSVIVLGIAAVIIGIAANYPLHFTFHRQELDLKAAGAGRPDGRSDSRRQTLRDVSKPLIVGNITTVGAFLTLLPLDAASIRDLGLFSALMLAGTILYVLVFMPQWRREARPRRLAAGSRTFDCIPDFHASRPWVRRATLSAIAVATALLAIPAADITFDADISHINYMTPQQREDMKAWEAMNGNDGTVTPVYITCTSSGGDRADRLTGASTARHPFELVGRTVDSLRRCGKVSGVRIPTDFIPSAAGQRRRLDRWKRLADTIMSHEATLDAWMLRTGFSTEAFATFRAMLHADLQVLPDEAFEPVRTTALTGYVHHGAMLARVDVRREDAGEVEGLLRSKLQAQAGTQVFDHQSLNRRIMNSLTDNFNFIGLTCGCIVFVFLWLSFGRIEIAILAFLPMAVGWVWILGVMRLLGLQFNIVNVILATFIFGQGDDYTIFVTEGLIQDHRHHGHTLRGFQLSILLSALIMLLGVGTLVIARHPAMFSLGAVTIIGMTIVVLMAWVLPPLLFHYLLRVDPSLRRWLDRQQS